MKPDSEIHVDLAGLVSTLEGLGGQLDGLQQQVDALSKQVQALNLDMPRPMNDFGPRISDGASATSLAGTDLSLGGPVGGADKGGAGYGAKEASHSSGQPGHQK